VRPPRNGSLSVRPRHRWMPFHRQALLGVQLRAHRGVDAIGADQHVGRLNHETTGPPVPQLHRHPSIAVLEALNSQPGPDRVSTKATPHSVQQHHLQFTSMDRVLRPAVASGQTPWLNANPATEAVVRDQRFGRDAGGRQFVGQPKRDQLTSGVRKDVDADTERPQLPSGLNDSHLDARRMQAQRRRQPAKARAADQDIHDKTPHRYARQSARRSPRRRPKSGETARCGEPVADCLLSPRWVAADRATAWDVPMWSIGPARS
jgi:hypothetical protein